MDQKAVGIFYHVGCISRATINKDLNTDRFSSALANCQLAQEAARSLQKEYALLPSAYQIRFAGYKGMVAVDLNMPAHLKLRLRPSMRKFDSKHLHLEVIQATRFLPGHLNRQIILLLSALGVRDGAFITLLNKMIVRFEEMLVKNEVRSDKFL